MRAFTAVFSKFKSSRFARNTATLTVGTAVAQFITIGAMPVISRLYSPADFGLLAVFLAVASIAATSSTLRYEKCILLPKEESESASLVLLSLALILAFGTVFGTVAWLLPGNFRTLIGVSSLEVWFPIAILSGMGMAIVAVGTSWLNRQCAYVKMTQIRVTQTAMGTIFSIILGVYGILQGLIIGQIVALLAAAIMAIASIPALSPYWKKSLLRNVAVKHNAAPKYLFPTALLDVITLHLPVFLIVAWFSTEKAGQFSMAWKIMALPIGLIGGAMGQVFLQRFSELWPDALSAQKLLFRTWKILALAGVLPSIVVMIFGEQLFIWVLGESWSEAGRMASVLAPMLLAILISSPTSGTFLVLGLQKYSLVFGIAVFLYRPACLSVGLVTGNIFYGLLAWVILEILQIFIYQVVVLKRLRVNI